MKGIQSHILILAVVTLSLLLPFPSDISLLSWIWKWTHPVTEVRHPTYLDFFLLLCTITGTTITVKTALVAHPYSSCNWSLLASFGLVCSSLLRSNSHAAIISVSLWTLFFLALHSSQWDRRAVILILVVIFSTQIAVTIGAFFLADQFTTPGFGKRAGGLYSNPNLIYPWSMLWFFIFWELARLPLKPSLKTILFSGALGSMLVLLLTFSRAGWIGVAVSLIFVARRETRIKARLSCIACVFLLIIGSSIIRTQGELVNTANDKSVNARIIIWRDAINLWKKNLWFGHGYNTFQKLSDLDQPPTEPKNLYLNIGVQFGLIGILLYIGYFGHLILIAKNMACNAHAALIDRAIASSVFLSIISLLVAGIFDTPVFGPTDRIPTTASFLILSGLLQASIYQNRKSGVSNVSNSSEQA